MVSCWRPGRRRKAEPEQNTGGSRDRERRAGGGQVLRPQEMRREVERKRGGDKVIRKD